MLLILQGVRPWRRLARACLAVCLAFAACAIPGAGAHAASRPVPGAAPRPLDMRVIESGHSLTDPIPALLARMVAAAGGRNPVVDRSTIPGSGLDWRWNHPPGYGLPDARAAIGGYDALVITEAAPLSRMMPWLASEADALRWFTHAWTKGNGGRGARTILYATWAELSSGPDFVNPDKDPEGNVPWRDRLPLEFERWLRILGHVNANRPAGSPEMLLIPGPLLMAALHDAIAAGRAPGISRISDVFLDDIHLNDLGAYFIALAHYAVIYGRDPRELPVRTGAGAGRAPGPELARWMQALVWEVVSVYALR